MKPFIFIFTHSSLLTHLQGQRGDHLMRLGETKQAQGAKLPGKRLEHRASLAGQTNLAGVALHAGFKFWLDEFS